MRSWATFSLRKKMRDRFGDEPVLAAQTLSCVHEDLLEVFRASLTDEVFGQIDEDRFQ